MIHLPALIQDLGFILITAAFITLIFKKLKQPVVLGYLIAGFLVGPHVPFIPTVTDVESIKVWAEIGVIFLLFGLGLEFSFKKLTQVGKSASITALCEVLFMLGAGYLTGQLLGWSKMDSLFLGGILSISSTTIIVRAFDELGLKGRNFVSLVFGVLIVEDLVAILLLVLLSSVAATQALSGTELIDSSMRLGFFLVLWFIVGIYVLPVLLRKIMPLLTDETLLVVAIGLCLFMVMIATNLGFSPALGAFVMGSLLAETRHAHRIEHLMIPVRDLFAAVFFVSVGMLIDPDVLAKYYHVIILITLITIVGKFISSGVGALISGRSLKVSVQTGMSLAQIGEFSFIIATLGMTLKVTSDFLYPVAVAVSAITTFTTPYLIQAADPFYRWIEKSLPQNTKDRLARYESAMATSSGQTLIKLLWSEYGIRIFLNSIVVIAITLAIKTFAGHLGSLAGTLLALVLSGPFLWAVVMSTPKHNESHDSATIDSLKKLQFGIWVIRFILGSLLVIYIISQFGSLSFIAAASIITLALLGIYFSRYAEPFYQSIEQRFVENLTDKERLELEKQSKTPQLAPWNANLSELIVSPHSPFVAKNLEDLAIKEKFGVTIAMIQRGEEYIIAPGRTDLLLPYDRVFLIATDEQLTAIKMTLEHKAIEEKGNDLKDTIGLTSLLVTNESEFANKTIRECGLRQKVSGLIVGIEREGQRILNPDSMIQILEGDLIWIVGDLKGLNQIKKGPLS